MGGARCGSRGDPRGHPCHRHRTTHRQNVSIPRMHGLFLSLNFCKDSAFFKVADWLWPLV